jgi:hypothetical protein
VQEQNSGAGLAGKIRRLDFEAIAGGEIDDFTCGQLLRGGSEGEQQEREHARKEAVTSHGKPPHHIIRPQAGGIVSKNVALKCFILLFGDPAAIEQVHRKRFAMAKRYTVFVDDNYHYMDESERYKLGEFDDCQSAVAACKSIVEEFLAQCDPNQTAEQIYQAYTGFGEDPWISNPDDSECRFSAWEYAKQRSSELARRT